MSTKERLLRLIQPAVMEPRAMPLPRKAKSRRAVHRVKTGAMGLTARLRCGVLISQGSLLDISVAGCCMRLASPAPAPHPFTIGATVHVALHTEAHTIICQAEVIALSGGETASDVRLRFRALPAQTQRALIEWVEELAKRDFQRRYTSSD